MSTAKQKLSPHSTAKHFEPYNGPNNSPIDHLAEQAQGRDDIRT